MLHILTAIVLSMGVLTACGRPNGEGSAAAIPDAVTPTSAAPAGDLLVIVNVDVVPMTDEAVMEDRAVVVRNGRVVEIVEMGGFEVPAGVEVIDAGGRYLLPGLIDFHVHLRAESELGSYLRHGVTTVVNMRGTPEVLELRERIRRGAASGPRVLTTGPLLDGDPPIWSGSATRVVTSVAQVRDIIAEHVRAGYDLIKVYNNLDPTVLEAVVAASHDAGLAVVGHLPRQPVRSEGLRQALAAGLDMIAHGEEVFFTHFGGAPDSLMRAGLYAPPADPEIDEAVRLIREADAAVTPNLSFIHMTARMLDDLQAVFDDPEFARLHPDVQEMWRDQNPTRRADVEAFAMRERIKYDVVRRLTRSLHAAGVPLLLGTDASAPGMYPGAATHVELAELVALGLTPWEALATATRNPGAFLTEHVAGTPPLGTISPGSTADLLLLDDNPLLDLAAVARPWRVIRAGRVVEDLYRAP